MCIKYNAENSRFILDTKNTRYVFEIILGKYPVHLYYGAKNDNIELKFDPVLYSFAPYFDDKYPALSPDTYPAELPCFGSGDFRTTSIKIKNKNGDSVCFFEYEGHKIFNGRLDLPGLPFAEADEYTETLELQLIDRVTNCKIKLYYTVFPNEDIISRYMTIENLSGSDAVIEKCMSISVDLPRCDYDMISLYGGHAQERNYQRNHLMHGMQSISSRRGASSAHFNPFIAICDRDADETKGDVYGFNFVFSGNFLDEVEVDQQSTTRVQIGLGSENFSWLLHDGESFTSPEAIMTFSENGINQMSRNFHAFTRAHILPPEPFEKRPVVLNTWEACFFDIDEKEMLRFAESAAECGTDMLVMDDGWFGARNDDTAGLGDWYVNTSKFKNGLASFVDKVKAHGIKFGIWVEPEMINPDSDLYRAHPEWCLQVKGRRNLLSRQQLVLDMANPEVIKYLKDIFTKTFDGVSLDYFKWDMNRHMSEVGSIYLPLERQGETAYRYMLGVYELLSFFRKQFPNAMIETCSGGGGRYDLGMMKYGTMIWASDNTYPKARIKIQYSSLLAYPATTMSCHVSNPENVCTKPAELKFRYEVALGGALGYEMHLPNASQEIRDTVKQQIINYREYEDIILRGDYYSLYNPYECDICAYYYTDRNHDRILMSALEVHGMRERKYRLAIPGADPNATYYDKIGDKTYSGKQLIYGFDYKTHDADPASQMWYFIKQ